jgi:hypothetical protein
MDYEVALSVNEYVDPEPLGDPEGWGNFTVGFSDVAAHEHSNDVERSVGVISAFPGVQRAERSDRELIMVWGEDVDLAALETTLLHWWADQVGSR